MALNDVLVEDVDVSFFAEYSSIINRLGGEALNPNIDFNSLLERLETLAQLVRSIDFVSISDTSRVANVIGQVRKRMSAIEDEKLFSQINAKVRQIETDASHRI